jgi:uncharacterized membrane protein (UPF0127 family)
MRIWFPVVLAVSLCCGCSRKSESGFAAPLDSTIVTLPDGTEIGAEVLMKPAEMARGMMFREALPQGRGLLFVHKQAGYYRYFMSNVKVPLDIVFMDDHRQIVDISADTPPCTTKPEDCLLYGGYHLEQYVLELRAGEARRLGLQKGQTLRF